MTNEEIATYDAALATTLAPKKGKGKAKAAAKGFPTPKAPRKGSKAKAKTAKAPKAKGSKLADECVDLLNQGLATAMTSAAGKASKAKGKAKGSKAPKAAPKAAKASKGKTKALTPKAKAAAKAKVAKAAVAKADLNEQCTTAELEAHGLPEAADLVAEAPPAGTALPEGHPVLDPTNPKGAPGNRYWTKRNAVTGAETGAYSAADQGLGTVGGNWAAVCWTHRVACHTKSLTGSIYFARHPNEFCEECAALAGAGDKHECAADTVGALVKTLRSPGDVLVEVEFYVNGNHDFMMVKANKADLVAKLGLLEPNTPSPFRLDVKVHMQTGTRLMELWRLSVDGD